MTREVDVAIIGAGSAGLSALAEVRKVTDAWALIDGGELGTTCARVGCMPSKALIQIADDFHHRRLFKRAGILGGEGLSVDSAAAMERVQDIRDLLVDKVLMSTTDEMGEAFIASNARFTAADTLALDNGETLRVRRGVVVATGSRPLLPAPWAALNGERRRVITTDDFFELESLPASVAVIGLGVIGLELGQAMARLGVEVHGFDLQSQIGGISDPAVGKVAQELIGKEFPLHLGAEVELAEGSDGRVQVNAGDTRVEVELVLASLGRRPNLAALGLETLDLTLDAHGLPPFDPASGRIADLNLFFAGDCSGHRPILHEANDEGRIAGYNVARLPAEPRRFQRRTPLAITFSDPNIARCGLRHDELPADAVSGEVQFGPLGRALIKGVNRGLLRVYAEPGSGRLLGAEMCCPNGENLAHLIAWCIQLGLGAADLLRLPYYHPVMEEALQGAIRDLVHQLGLPNPGLRDLNFAD